MNNYAISDLRDYIGINEENYDISEAIEEEDLIRRKERAKAIFSKQFGYVVGSTVAGWEVEIPSLSEQINELQRENILLRQEIVGLKSQLNELMKALPAEKTIVLREITKEEAKKEIQELFASTDEILYYSDIAERLRLDLTVVVEICKELIKEGKVKIDTEVS